MRVLHDGPRHEDLNDFIGFDRPDKGGSPQPGSRLRIASLN